MRKHQIATTFPGKPYSLLYIFILGDDILLQYTELRSNPQKFRVDVTYCSGNISCIQCLWVRIELFVQDQEAIQRWSKVNRVIDGMRATDEELYSFRT